MEQLIYNFSPKSLSGFFKSQISSFVPQNEEIHDSLKDGDKSSFSYLTKHGETLLKDKNELLVFSCKYNGALSDRSSRRKQFEIAKKVLKEDFKDGAIFVFYDDSNKFRFSFIRKNWGEKGDKRYSSWNRYTYFVDPKDTNKTFKDRVGNCKFSGLDDIQEAFSVEKLTREFYNDLFKWYQWTLSEEMGITFPNNTNIAEDDRVKLEEQVIRLITRILFVWFIKQKHLVPDLLFRKEELSKILRNFDPFSNTDGSYYNAILQNLFFATLNKAIDERDFARLQNTRDVKTLYRYEEMFSISNDEVLKLFRPIPFLNGGLFECLDKEDIEGNKYYLDGFSRNDKKLKGHFKHRAFIPNSVFFDEKNGLIPLLDRYNFTVEENAPNEVQVALDPELLGNVFENLLGAFNVETKETARKQSGSFYTPREIVNYMVEESLIAYVSSAVPKLEEEPIRQLFEGEELPKVFANDHRLCEYVSKELRKVKILDPACGSGAFPMGILNKMVVVLQKLDCNEEKTIYDQKLHLIEECIYGVDLQTIAAQISKLRFFISLICEQGAIDLKKENYGVLTLPNLETKFVAANTLMGIGRENKSLLNLNDEKLVKLKNQLWEIRKQHFYAKKASDKKKLREQDEQLRGEIKNYIAEKASKPNEELISVANGEIKKLKESRKNFEGENWIDETDRKKQTTLFGNLEEKQPSLFKVDKNKEAREKIDLKIKSIENDIFRERNKSVSVGFNAEVEAIAKWNPYDQNSSSPFFDPEWMFGLTNGFDHFQVLLTSDKLSEGFNLNRAGLIINYDIPWNPTRVIQRVGRINRIGSKVFDKLYIFNFFPSLKGADIVKSREIAQQKMFLIHNALGEDAKMFDADEEPTASALRSKLNQSPEEEGELSTITKIRNLYAELEKDYPEIISKVKDLPARVKTAKLYQEYQLNVLRRKGLNLFAQALGDDENREIREIDFEELIARVHCAFDEPTLKLSNSFWKKYEYIKEYQPKYKLGRSEISLEEKAIDNLKRSLKLLRELNFENLEFIHMLIRDIRHYHTLPTATIRRIGGKELKDDKKSIKLFAEEIIWLKRHLGADYLDKIQTTSKNKSKEVIIAVENLSESMASYH